MRTQSMMILVGAVLLMMASCMVEEGTEFKTDSIDEANELLGVRKCVTNLQCGVGRHCNEEHVCFAECGNTKDCYFKDERAMNAWNEAKKQGVAFEDFEFPDPAYKCSDCGRCIASELAEDPICPKMDIQLCATDTDCTDLGSAYTCGKEGYCTSACTVDEDCNPMGEGYLCDNAEGGDKRCYRWCYDDSSCAYHGFAWQCKLPDGVDPEKNFFKQDALTSVYGRCVLREEGVDWGKHNDPAKESYKLVGIYGALNESTFTNCGFPLVKCQDSVNVHHLLFRIIQTEDGIQMDGKYCWHEMRNFKVDPNNDTMDKLGPNDNLAWMEVPRRYTLRITYHHWLVPINEVKVGTKMRTSDYLEVRGALLDNPATDPMPTLQEPEPNWDQDRDGKPGLTTIMNGVITGEIYNCNRATQHGDFEVLKMTQDGKVDKMKGLLTTENESFVLGASNPSYAVQVENFMYKDPNRSYMRFVRLADTASCTDVLALGRPEVNTAPSPNGCGNDPNKRTLSIDNSKNWLCHTPTMDGPIGEGTK